MPSERRLTRLAMSYALEERKVAQACHAAWTEFAECAELVSLISDALRSNIEGPKSFSR